MSGWVPPLLPRPTAAMAADARWEAVPVLKDLLPRMECDSPPPAAETPITLKHEAKGNVQSEVRQMVVCRTR